MPIDSARNIDANPSDVKTMSAASGTFFLRYFYPCWPMPNKNASMRGYCRMVVGVNIGQPKSLMGVNDG
jgi:hypothetical protein